MSAMVYPAPYRLPAGILALAVHGAFFVLLYFGISWQTQPSQEMVVDIWNSLPETPSAPPEQAPPKAEKTPLPEVKKIPPPKLAAPEKQVAPPKADIDLSDKKKPVINPFVSRQSVEPKKNELVEAEHNAQLEQQRVRAEQAAARSKIVDEHIARIVAKIRRNIVNPPDDVPDSAQAEFDVILLPDGSVLSAKLVRSSGYAAYDSAVERAILKAQPLPLPQDPALFSRFRELRLKFILKE